MNEALPDGLPADLTCIVKLRTAFGEHVCPDLLDYLRAGAYTTDQILSAVREWCNKHMWNLEIRWGAGQRENHFWIQLQSNDDRCAAVDCDLDLCTGLMRVATMAARDIVGSE